MIANAADVMTASMPENELLAAVREACRVLGLLAYHTYRSDRSEPGFPDLVIVGPRGVLFRELKTEKGRPSHHQEKWIAALQAAGADAAIWRPSDLFNGRITSELRRVVPCKR